MSHDLSEAVRAHPRVRAASEARGAAESRRDDVAGELAGLESDLAALQARIEAVTSAGDPDAEVRTLTKERRTLNDRIEDASADMAAQEAAATGALHGECRAILAAMGEVWSDVDVAGVSDRVRLALTDLAAAFDDLGALEREHGALGNWARHLVGRVLEGSAQAPQLDAPRTGIPPGKLGELRRAVASAAKDIHTETEVAA